MDLFSILLLAKPLLDQFSGTIGANWGGKIANSGLVKSIREGHAIRREEIRIAGERQEKAYFEARKLKLEELQKSFEYQEILQNQRIGLSNWPLPNFPKEIIDASQASNGRTLNIILKLVDPHTEELEYKKTASALASSTKLFTSANMVAIDRIKSYFGNNILLYLDPIKTERLLADSLRAKIWSLLRTEPVVLIEFYVRRPDQFSLQLSHWGNSFVIEDRWQVMEPLHINLDTVETSKEYRETALMLALSTIIIGIADSYRALRFSRELIPPIFPKFVSDTKKHNMPEEIWKPVVDSYLHLYDLLASRDALHASEMAAAAAVAAHDSGLNLFSISLLEKAISLHPNLNRPLINDSHTDWILKRQEHQGDSCMLRRALIALEGEEWDAHMRRSNEERDFQQFIKDFNV